VKKLKRNGYKPNREKNKTIRGLMIGELCFRPKSLQRKLKFRILNSRTTRSMITSTIFKMHFMKPRQRQNLTRLFPDCKQLLRISSLATSNSTKCGLREVNLKKSSVV